MTEKSWNFHTVIRHPNWHTIICPKQIKFTFNDSYIFVDNFLVKRLLYVITLFHVISAFFPNKVLLCSTLNNCVISLNRRKNARLGSYDRFNRNLLKWAYDFVPNVTKWKVTWWWRVTLKKLSNFFFRQIDESHNDLLLL